ncbi:BTAD domain-containing putative transcriptional regulator [Geodermatophilus sp. SYSU D00696]
MDDTQQLRIGLLGPVTASSAGVPLDLGGPRQRAVLVVLVLARGEVVPVGSLVQAVWGDDPPEDDVGALQAYVSHLRRRLQPGSAARTRSAVIVREGRGYAVRLPPDAVDAWRFEALVQQAGATEDPVAAVALLDQALALWRGPALAEYADEPWAEAATGRLAELRAVARERRADARLRCGEAALLVPDLEAMVAEEPLREERWRLLALALYRAHRQADALAALRRARTALAEELGVDPGPALRELEQQVLAQAPALHGPPGPAGRRPAPPAAHASVPGSGAGAGDELLDRDREVAAVHAALDDLTAGEHGVLLVEGPAGIGKSRLLAETRRLAAERSVRVLAARGSQLERSFGFGIARQLFEPLLAGERGEALLSGAAASARGVFDLAPAEPADGSFAALHGLYWLVVDLTAEGPLVLAVDDLQWSDGASLRFLAYLVRRLESLPVLVVATVRTGEADDDEALVGELALDPAAVVLRPAPLSLPATERMVGRRLGEPVSPLFAQACHRTTSGIPLLLRQLLRGLEADRVRPDAAHADTVVAVGSRAVSSMVLVRLRRMPPEVADVARAAAVLGDGASLPAVAALAGCGEATAAAALAALARAEVVRDEQPVAFVHPLVREAIHRDLPAAERALHHERAAALLRAAGASDEQVAAHLLLAPRRHDDATVAVLQRAARTAAERGASDSAVTHLRRALDEPPSDARRRDVLTDLGLLEALLDGAAGVGHLLEAHALHEDPRARADIATAVARTLVFAGERGVATAFAREAASVLPDELADHRQALQAIEMTSGYMHALDPAVWRRDVPDPSGEGHGAQMLAAALAYDVTIQGTDRARAVRLARAALAGDRLWEVDSGLFWVVAAIIRMLADDDVGDFWDRARAHAHARGSLFAAMSTNIWQGFWHGRRGEFDEAESCLTEALEQVAMWGGAAVGAPFAAAFRIGVRLDRGDVAGARAAADAAAAVPAAGDGDRLLRLAGARLLVAEGRCADALDALAAIPAPIPIPNPVWNPWRGITAAALAGLGRTGEAADLLETEADLLRRWGAPSALGPALVRLGRLRGDNGVDLLREGVALLEGTTAAVELARARCALGGVARLPDREAVPLLRDALRAAREHGAAALAEEACAALRARGCTDDPARDAVRRPSPTERRILQLAGDGYGTREVAQRLFLTPGTVRAVLESAATDGGLRFSSSADRQRVGTPTGGPP